MKIWKIWKIAKKEFSSEDLYRLSKCELLLIGITHYDTLIIDKLTPIDVFKKNIEYYTNYAKSFGIENISIIHDDVFTHYNSAKDLRWRIYNNGTFIWTMFEPNWGIVKYTIHELKNEGIRIDRIKSGNGN